jgi:hypothetical protein
MPHSSLIEHGLHQVRLWIVEAGQTTVFCQNSGDDRRNEITSIDHTDKGRGVTHQIESNRGVNLSVFHK